MRPTVGILLVLAGCRAASASEEPATRVPLPAVDTVAPRARLVPPPPPVVEGPARCPPNMADVGTFCVDRWEAHLLVLGEDGRLVPHPHSERPPDGGYFVAASAPGRFPQGYISRKESALACRRAGKRLCSFPEWRRACQGPRWLRYPYGGSFRRGVCNVDKPHLLQELYGGDSSTWKYDEHFNNPELNAKPGFLAPSGAYGGCASPDGAFDMAGSLHEWVSTTVTDEFMEALEEEPVDRIDQPWVEGNAMFLGGFFSTRDQHGPGCYYTTVAHEPTYHDYSTGFRCCADAAKAPASPPRLAPGGVRR
jgi:hypothetical protein